MLQSELVTLTENNAYFCYPDVEDIATEVV